MPFVVEDGTGKPDANSYASVEFALDYFTLRGVDKWLDKEPEEQQGALIKATDYAELRKCSFIGTPAVEGQALHFPIVEGEMPTSLQKAVCEYALRALDGPLAPDPVTDANGLTVVQTKKKIGPIEKAFTVVGGADATPPVFRSYPAADALLRQLMRAAQNKVIR